MVEFKTPWEETEKRRCSYVELVADGPQIPDYCTSADLIPSFV
jgi:hypothetical protein